MLISKDCEQKMSTLADVKVAEDAMIAAQKALRVYTDNTDKKDVEVEARLIAALRKATDNYLNTVIALGSK